MPPLRSPSTAPPVAASVATGRSLALLRVNCLGKADARDGIERAKSRDFRPILASLGKPGRTPEGLAGAKGFGPRYGELEIRRSRLFEMSHRTRSWLIHKLFETFGFREPYRIFEVPSFGEKWGLRRIMCRLCRLGVRSSD